MLPLHYHAAQFPCSRFSLSPSLSVSLHLTSPFLSPSLSPPSIQLHHPNVVHYHKCFEEGGHLYIVMELIEGASLCDCLTSMAEKKERFEEDRIWRIFTQVSPSASSIVEHFNSSLHRLL